LLDDPGIRVEEIEFPELFKLFIGALGFDH
jgi:hypothetical protein